MRVVHSLSPQFMYTAAPNPALKRKRTPDIPTERKSSPANRQLLNGGYRHAVTGQLLANAMPLERTFDTFDETGVLDLSEGWTEEQLATLPHDFYESFPAEGGLTVRIGANLGRLPAALLKQPIKALVFVGPVDRRGAMIDLCRVRGPDGDPPELDVSTLQNARCVVPLEWHRNIRTGGHCTLMDPSALVFHGLSREPRTCPTLGDQEANLLQSSTVRACQAVTRYLSQNKQLDVTQKALILERLHRTGRVSSEDAGWIARELLQLATDLNDPPTAVELRQICQTFACLVDQPGKPSAAVGPLLVAALELAKEACFPEGPGPVHWRQSVLRKIDDKQTLGKDVQERLSTLIREIEADCSGSQYLMQDCARARACLRISAEQIQNLARNVASQFDAGVFNPNTLAALQELMQFEPSLRHDLANLIRNALGPPPTAERTANGPKT